MRSSMPKIAAMAALTLALAACGSRIDNRLDPVSPEFEGVDDSLSPRQHFEQVVGDRVLFESDQSSLNPLAMSILDRQAEWLAQNPDQKVVIEGHADEQGTREYNLALGARRASAAQSYLVSKGVDSRRLQIVSYGKERPVSICSAESCWSKNRRAVTVVGSE